MKILFTILGIGVLNSLSVSAMAETTKLPLFTDYPTKVFIGRKAPINYQSHPIAKMYQTRIKDSYNQPKPDFAGSYSITAWGCGSSCINYAMTDRKTGNVYALSDLAYKVTEHASKSCANVPDSDVSNPSEFVSRANSLLLVAQQYCKTDGNGKDITLNNYLLWQEKNKTFKLLKQSFQ